MAISTRQMVACWAKRVAELEAMRPITASEALAKAERLEASADAREQAAADAENAPREAGRLAEGDTLEARGMRNNAALGAARRAVWGETTRALQERQQAEALRRIAGETEGAALAASLTEARGRLEYYTRLLARETA